MTDFGDLAQACGCVRSRANCAACKGRVACSASPPSLSLSESPCRTRSRSHSCSSSKRCGSRDRPSVSAAGNPGGARACHGMSRWNHALNVAKRASERVSQQPQRCDRQGKTRAKHGAFPARACSLGSQLREGLACVPGRAA